MKLFDAKITRITKMLTKNGNPGVLVECISPDGSKYGLKLTDFIHFDSDQYWSRWSKLVDNTTDPKEQRRIVIGDDVRLMGLEVEVSAAQNDDGYWNVRGVELKAIKETVTDDDIPF